MSTKMSYINIDYGCHNENDIKNYCANVGGKGYTSSGFTRDNKEQ